MRVCPCWFVGTFADGVFTIRAHNEVAPRDRGIVAPPHDGIWYWSGVVVRLDALDEDGDPDHGWRMVGAWTEVPAP